MKIRLKTSLSGYVGDEKVDAAPGEVVDLPDDMAGRMIERDMAELVSDGPKRRRGGRKIDVRTDDEVETR